MAVTRSPHALRSTPILLAVTPFPRPLTTPPVTSRYFIFFYPKNTEENRVKQSSVNKELVFFINVGSVISVNGILRKSMT